MLIRPLCDPRPQPDNAHEETRATASQKLTVSQGRYLVVRDRAEALVVCDCIRHGGEARAWLARFGKAVSGDFDPDRDLQRIGLAPESRVTFLLQAQSQRPIIYTDTGSSLSRRVTIKSREIDMPNATRPTKPRRFVWQVLIIGAFAVAALAGAVSGALFAYSTNPSAAVRSKVLLRRRHSRSPREQPARLVQHTTDLAQLDNTSAILHFGLALIDARTTSLKIGLKL